MGMNSRIRLVGWALCVLAGISVSGFAFAQAAGAVKITNAVFQEVQVKGPDGKITTKLVPATKAAPGDEVVYEIGYRNDGANTATELAINNPLPREVTFVSASKDPTVVSVDGGKTFGLLAQLTVPGPNGRPRQARASDITNLRWVLPTLPGGASGKLTFRATVK